MISTVAQTITEISKKQEEKPCQQQKRNPQPVKSAEM